MHIYYDFELDDSNLAESFSDNTRTALQLMLAFLTQRFSVLEEKMQKEYELYDAFIVIFIPKAKGETFRIGYHKYSTDLKEKLQSCLDENNINYLNNLLAPFFPNK